MKLKSFSDEVVFCSSVSRRTRTWTFTPSCPNNNYTWEIPAGWSVNGDDTIVYGDLSYSDR